MEPVKKTLVPKLRNSRLLWRSKDLRVVHLISVAAAMVLTLQLIQKANVQKVVTVLALTREASTVVVIRVGLKFQKNSVLVAVEPLEVAGHLRISFSRDTQIVSPLRLRQLQILRLLHQPYLSFKQKVQRQLLPRQRQRRHLLHRPLARRLLSRQLEQNRLQRHHLHYRQQLFRRLLASPAR